MISMPHSRTSPSTCDECASGHARLIWFYDGSPLLSQAGRAAIEDENNRPFLSAASFVEIGIKISLGKLRLSASTAVILDSYVGSGARVLDINPSHGMALETLPFHHRDPFDRLLAAQALAEDMMLISKDAVFDQYGVKRLW